MAKANELKEELQEWFSNDNFLFEFTHTVWVGWFLGAIKLSKGMNWIGKILTVVIMFIYCSLFYVPFASLIIAVGVIMFVALLLVALLTFIFTVNPKKLFNRNGVDH